MTSHDTVMVVAAHSDDQILGPGATLAKYAKEGKRVVTVILSYGETSHPHFKEEVIIKIRVDESQKADDVIGGYSLHFFDLKELNFQKEALSKNVHEKLEVLVKEFSPSKIFTHSIDDPHPDHRATFHLVYSIAQAIHYEGRILSFDVWNIFPLKNRMSPKLYVDVSDTFSKKVKAMKCFKSQKLAMLSLTWLIYFRAYCHGWFSGCKYAERFYIVQ